MQIVAPSPLVAFVDDDRGYLAWLAANPGGYVVNTTRSPRPDYLMLHRASCRHISGADERRWTFNYAKVCGPSQASLSAWAIQTVGAEALPCSLCEP